MDSCVVHVYEATNTDQGILIKYISSEVPNEVEVKVLAERVVRLTEHHSNLRRQHLSLCHVPFFL